MTTVKALVLPIFRRYWLWHAVGEAPAAAASVAPAAAAAAGAPLAQRTWSQGATLEERFQILAERATAAAAARLRAEWRRAEAAAEGSLRHRAYRAAQAVLAREDPRESFLKAVPTEAGGALEVAYPAALPERLVRRRLRLLAAGARARHRARAAAWAAALLPQAPLMLTPLPNVTVYYTAYRLYSHWRALQGCRALDRSFAASDTAQLSALRDALARHQRDARGGAPYAPGSWPARLVAAEARYWDVFERVRQLKQRRRLQELAEGAPPEAVDAPAAAAARRVGPALEFVPSTELAAAIGGGAGGVGAAGAGARAPAVPLSDDAAVAVAKLFGARGLLEAVARARRRATGSAFPVDVI